MIKITAASRMQLALNSTTYAKRILDLNPLEYWRLDETVGSVAIAQVNPVRNGTITGVNLNSATFRNGDSAGYWDGTNDRIGIATTDGSNGLIDTMSTTEFTVGLWFKVDSGIWTDNTLRRTLTIGRADGQNTIVLGKIASNELRWRYEAGNINKQVDIATTPVDWTFMVMTVSVTNDEMIAYQDGLQVGTTQTELGTWAGAITVGNIGANLDTPTNVWDGNISQVFIANRAITAAEVLALSVV